MPELADQIVGNYLERPKAGPQDEGQDAQSSGLDSTMWQEGQIARCIATPERRGTGMCRVKSSEPLDARFREYGKEIIGEVPELAERA